MENEIKCPYCSMPMVRGVIHQTGLYGIKWIPLDQDKGCILSPLIGGIYLTSGLDRNQVEALYCAACGKIVIDLNETGSA